ncbi:Ionotropic receptor 262 [Frankliniella occidentalis]|nr:Ionotropic receptor 262 [Frankliniella occidentalis]
MSTRRLLLSAAILCLTTGNICCNLVSVLTHRIEYHPEVPCALELIPPNFQLNENANATYAPRLYVFGKADWLNKFLWQFPCVASIYLFSDEENVLKDFIQAGMMPSASLALFLNSLELLPAAPFRVRTVSWLSFDSIVEADSYLSEFLAKPDESHEIESDISEETDAILRELSDLDDAIPDTLVVRRPGRCHRFARVMITTRPRGSTHVIALPMPCDLREEPKILYELLGVWSPGPGWSSPDVSLFPPPCVSWTPPPYGQPLVAEIFSFMKRYGNDDTVMGSDVKGTEAFEILRLLKDSYSLRFDIRINSTTDFYHPLRAADMCQLDIVAWERILIGASVSSHTELSLFTWKMYGTVCIVPVGAGKPYDKLYPVTAEYTVGVWIVLVGALIVVGTILYLMRRGESAQLIALLSLSPLLGQPMGDRQIGAQVPLVGSWLLTSVVVNGAYQGQLLSFITDPPLTREVSSWQDWLESDLLLKTTYQSTLEGLIQDGFYNLTADRVLADGNDFRQNIDEMLTHRKTSFCMTTYNYEREMNLYPKQITDMVNTFTLVTSMKVMSPYVTTKGSPFEVPLRKLLGRIRAAGGLRFHSKPLLQDIAATKGNEEEKENTVIAIRNIKPVILVYIWGNILAFLCFVKETFNCRILCSYCGSFCRKNIRVLLIMFALLTVISCCPSLYRHGL